MNEIELNVSGTVYRLTNLNNGNKYDRALKYAGQDGTPAQKLAHYDKLEGYIQNANGQKIANGEFWQAEKNRLEKEFKHEEGWNKKKGAVRSFVEMIKGAREILWFTLFIILVITLILDIARN